MLFLTLVFAFYINGQDSPAFIEPQIFVQILYISFLLTIYKNLQTLGTTNFFYFPCYIIESPTSG